MHKKARLIFALDEIIRLVGTKCDQVFVQLPYHPCLFVCVCVCVCVCLCVCVCVCVCVCGCGCVF